MAEVQHKDIPNANLHEPKDIVSALADQYYRADGSGSGDWLYNDYELTYIITAANTSQTVQLAIPYNSRLINVYAVVDSAFSADQAIDFAVNSSPITAASVALVSIGSAAGSVYTSTASTGNNVAQGEALTIDNAGGSVSSFTITLTLVFQRVG